jgi:hypothetical protein
LNNLLRRTLARSTGVRARNTLHTHAPTIAIPPPKKRGQPPFQKG